MSGCPIDWDAETDRMLAAEGQSLFWLDLADDLRDPMFRRAYEAETRRIADEGGVA